MKIQGCDKKVEVDTRTCDTQQIHREVNRNE